MRYDLVIKIHAQDNSLAFTISYQTYALEFNRKMSCLITYFSRVPKFQLICLENIKNLSIKIWYGKSKSFFYFFERKYLHQLTFFIQIVPPSGWKARSTSYDEALKNLIIKNPIQQNPEGKMGVY